LEQPNRLAYIAEHVEGDSDDLDLDVLGANGGTRIGFWLMATFDVHVESQPSTQEGYEPGLSEVSLDEALAWARERTDAIVLRLGDRRHQYSAGRWRIPGLRPWPPADLRPLVRRRDPGDLWKDRSADEAAIPWRITVLLTLPHETADTSRVSDDAPVEAFAARTGATSWDRDPLDGYLADVHRDPTSHMWSTNHAPAWRVYYHLEASTRDAATDLVLARIGDPPDGLKIAAAALPALDLDELDAAEQRAAFDKFAAKHQPRPGTDPLLSALDALLLTEAVPDVDQLTAFITRHGVELGDNHFATNRTQWLPLLDDADDRALLLEVDENGLVDSAAITRIDTWRQVS
jgi:hypothetical protein